MLDLELQRPLKRLESTQLASEFYLGKLNQNLLVSLIVNLVKKTKKEDGVTFVHRKFCHFCFCFSSFITSVVNVTRTSWDPSLETILECVEEDRRTSHFLFSFVFLVFAFE